MKATKQGQLNITRVRAKIKGKKATIDPYACGSKFDTCFNRQQAHFLAPLLGNKQSRSERLYLFQFILLVFFLHLLNFDHPQKAI
jgi:hypothetical protein